MKPPRPKVWLPRRLWLPDLSPGCEVRPRTSLWAPSASLVSRSCVPKGCRRRRPRPLLTDQAEQLPGPGGGLRWVTGHAHTWPSQLPRGHGVVPAEEAASPASGAGAAVLLASSQVLLDPRAGQSTTHGRLRPRAQDCVWGGALAFLPCPARRASRRSSHPQCGHLGTPQGRLHCLLLLHRLLPVADLD